MLYIRLAILVLLLGGAVACSSVAYHHSERNSLALEVRQTDPAQPVHGTFGLKTRTVLVSPEAVDGNAASVVSDFRLARTTKGVFGRTRIDSMFLTGKAAVNASPGAAAAVGGLSSAKVGSDAALAQKEVLRNIHATATALAQSGDETAMGLVARLDKLGELVPSAVPSSVPFYDIDGANRLTPQAPALRRATFVDAVDFLDAYDTSIASIEIAKLDRSVLAAGGGVISSAQLLKFEDELKALLKERADFAADLANSPAFDRAAKYVLSRI